MALIKDTQVDMLFMEYLQDHFRSMAKDDYQNLQMFLGPDNGANNPAYFAHLDKLYAKYKILKKLLPTVRSTAGLYDKPSRSNTGIIKVWTLIMDFDYDRGEWTGATREVQDKTLYEFCSWLPPTTVVQTGHGWHLYWLLKNPVGDGQYAYAADLIRKQLKADVRSILPVQCMNLYNHAGNKTAVMVDRLSLQSINAQILTFPHVLSIYNIEELKDKIAGDTDTPNIRLLKERQYEKRRTPLSNSMNDIKNESMEILEHYDLAYELNKAGYAAYYRAGGKIICSCPFHDDRHPSAYIDINPNSQFFGWLYCTSTHCMRHVPIKKVMQEIGAIT